MPQPAITTSKMSKSDPSPGSRIGVYDSPETIRRHVMRATTDSLRDAEQ